MNVANHVAKCSRIMIRPFAPKAVQERIPYPRNVQRAAELRSEWLSKAVTLSIK